MKQAEKQVAPNLPTAKPKQEEHPFKRVTKRSNTVHIQ